MEKVTEYVDYTFKPIMQDRWSYIKDSGDFIKEIKNTGKIPEGFSYSGRYWTLPCISHGTGLKAL